jgi:hypothetical protein
MKYPSDWEVREVNENFFVGVNFYKKSQTGLRFPLTHHSDATQVSVFPRGIPTEGVSGENRDSTFALPVQAEKNKEFFLSDGTVWARYFAGFKTRPSSWDEFGFIWTGLRIEDGKTTCLRNNQEVSQDQCNSLGGDQIIRFGKVNSEDKAVEEKMLRSFRFLP